MHKLFPLLLSVWLVMANHTFAQTDLKIEVFDVSESKVIKVIPLTEHNKEEAVKLIKSIDSLYPKLNPTPRTGIMIKVPFDPILQIENKLIQHPIKEGIFIIPEGDRPYLLIFDAENKPMFYYFQEDHRAFLAQLGLS